MSADLDDQLAAYGSWLRHTYSADLTPPASRTGVSGDIGISLEADRRPGVGHRWLRVAAALLVVVGIGGLFIAQRNSDRPPAAAQHTSPIDPAAHLFVLPADSERLELAGGGAYTAQRGQGSTQLEISAGVLLGTAHDGGFSDLVDIRISSSFPEAFAMDASSEVETPTGPAIVAEGALPFQRVAQQRGDVWLLLTGADVSHDLVDVLGQVAIDSSGALTVQGGERAVIEQFSHDLAAVDYSTSYEATDPATGVTFVVETAASPSAMVLGAYTSNMVTPTTVNGTQAWVLTRGVDQPDGIDTGIVWRASPNRVIAVSAHADADVVKAIAERLRQVTEDEWLTALPGAVIDD